MFIATVHKAERKTVVESALVSSVIGIQSEGFSSNFLPLQWGPGDSFSAGAALVFQCFRCCDLLYTYSVENSVHEVLLKY